VTIRASQSGNDIYSAAPDVQQQITIAPPENSLTVLVKTSTNVVLAFNGIVGQTYTLQTSSNLHDWVGITNVLCSATPMVLQPVVATSPSGRIYRMLR
jgi:hypothetical protein